MRPSYLPHLINGSGGDPALYIDSQFERRAFLFDAGELTALAARKLLRIGDVFISHMHMDHFIGLDHLVRVMLGRDKRLALYGPPGLIEQTAHKLAAYTWNLVHNYRTDFTLLVTELHASGVAARARLRCKNAFRCEPLPPVEIPDGVLLDEGNLRIRAALLDHSTPSLAYALEERCHVNVWKNRLDEMDLTTGAWLRDLKHAALRDDLDDETPIPVAWRNPSPARPRTLSLGQLRPLLHVVPGQKIAYVVDAVYHEANIERIRALAAGADQLFIEAVFLERDAAEAAYRSHLTARQAGALARLARVQRCTPFHFSARYAGAEHELLSEAEAAFRVPSP